MVERKYLIEVTFPKLSTDSERGLAGDILKGSFENESTENQPHKSQCFHLSTQK